MRSGGKPFRWAAAACALAMAGLLAAGCGDEGDDGAQPAPQPATTTPGAVGGGMVEEYFGTGPYEGQTVTVQGEVTKIISPIAFELAAGPYGDDSVLVLSRSEMTDVAVGDTVMVTGTVRDFTAAEYGDEYGIAGDGTYDAYENERFLESATIEPVPGG